MISPRASRLETSIRHRIHAFLFCRTAGAHGPCFRITTSLALLSNIPYQAFSTKRCIISSPHVGFLLPYRYYRCPSSPSRYSFPVDELGLFLIPFSPNCCFLCTRLHSHNQNLILLRLFRVLLAWSLRSLIYDKGGEVAN